MKKLKFFAAALFGALGLSASAAPTTITQGDFTFEVLNDTAVCLTAYTGIEPELVVPASVTVNRELYKVTKIGNECCRGNRSIEVLKVPAPISHIDHYAFADCSSLKTIVLPATTAFLGECCFAIDPVDTVTVYALDPPENPGYFNHGSTMTTVWWYYNNIFKGIAGETIHLEHYMADPQENSNEKKASAMDQIVDATLLVPPMSLYKYKECTFDEGGKRKGVWGLFKRKEAIPDYLSGLDDIYTGASESAQTPATIYDITGRTVKENATVNDIQTLPQGLYIFKGKKYVVGN